MDRSTIGTMEFKPRDYRAVESRAASLLPRSPAHDNHPLAPPPSPLPPTAASQVAITESEKVEFYDPLRIDSRDAATSIEDVQHVSIASKATRRLSDKTSQVAAKEWTTFKRLLLQKFSSSSTISISSASDILARSRKDSEKSLTEIHPEEQDGVKKTTKDEIKVITRQEYVFRLNGLKDEIVQAWSACDRVAALKLSIKVARLLMDTTAVQFYPALFVLVTEILDMLGELVWERIKRKAEYADDGTSICSLAEQFVSSDVGTDAKETCNNWFCKIGSIRELLPRIYLELSILRCWRFLQDDPSSILQRLTMMMKGIADPVAFAYCHLYMAKSAQSLNQNDIGYMMASISDINILLRRIILGKESIHNFSHQKRNFPIPIIEPAIEWIMKCISITADENKDMLALFGVGRSLPTSTGSIPYSLLVLYYLLKELPAEVVSVNAFEILKHFEHYKDTSFEEHLNFRLVGLKLSESELPKDSVCFILDEMIQAITHYEELIKYLLVVDAYMEVILQHQMDHYLHAILEGISKRVLNRSISEDELESLRSILVKLINSFNNLEDLFSLNHFMELVDSVHGEHRDMVNMNILSRVSRRKFIHEATTIQLLFEVSQAVHDRIDLSNKKHDYSQRANLICRFLQMVDFGFEKEGHLNFLIECRAAFGSFDELKETFVHSSNSLAIRAIKDGKRFLGFIKACVSFNEVTIPSISSSVISITLYLETAEVALLSGLASHANGLIGSSVACLQSLDSTFGSRTPTDVPRILSSICKLCSILVVVPGCHEEGIAYICRIIISSFHSQLCISTSVKIKAFCAIVSLSATVSQEKLPYYVSCKEIVGNDLLFYGDASFHKELVSLSTVAVQNIVDIVEKDPHSAALGKVALEACNCLIVSFKANDQVSSICSRLIEIARSSLHSNDKYLQSTTNFCSKYLQEFL